MKHNLGEAQPLGQSVLRTVGCELLCSYGGRSGVCTESEVRLGMSHCRGDHGILERGTRCKSRHK